MEQKNVITIIADDMGAWATGEKAGNTEVKTPNIDALAEDGVSFSNFYCVSPVCSPARASIYSGTIPSSHGVFDWVAAGNLDKEELGELKSAPEFSNEESSIRFMDDTLTYTELMEEVGYRCSLSGKWHLGDSLNPQKGYQDWYALGRGGCEYMRPDIVEDGEISFKNEYVTHSITNNALKIIETFDDGEPHYLNVAYTAPHSPWDKDNHPEKYRNLYRDCSFDSVPKEDHHPWQVPSAPVPHNEEERREYLTGYYAAISAMDEGIGKIVSSLKEKGLYQDTLIMFTSDNGMSMGHHGIWGKGYGTYPLNMYDSSIKVPMIMTWPNVLPHNKVINSNRSYYDIFPTLVDYLDLPTKEVKELSLPGKSLRSVLENETEADKTNTVVYDEYGATR